MNRHLANVVSCQSRNVSISNRLVLFNCQRSLSTKDDGENKSADSIGRALKNSKLAGSKKQNSSLLTNFKLSVSPRPRNPIPTTLKEAEKRQQLKAKAMPVSEEEIILGKEVFNAAVNVSEILGGAQVKSDLLKKLISFEKETFEASKPAPLPVSGDSQDKVMSGTLSSMKVSKDNVQVDPETVSQLGEARKFLDDMGVKFSHKTTLKGNRPMHHNFLKPPEPYKTINFFEGDRLNIFEPSPSGGEGQVATPASADHPQRPDLLPVWTRLASAHLRWLTDASPRNGFEEMIQWTEQGRMHPYPVDNEYGFFEKFVPFHEHVFLDRLLADDQRVPKTGPVREFLDLVVVGLSKNAYMKLERKHEHIEWFKEYFKDKVVEIGHMKENEDFLAQL